MPSKPIDWSDPSQWPADFYQGSQRPGAWQGAAIAYFSALEREEKAAAKAAAIKKESNMTASISGTMSRARSRSRSPMGSAAQ